MVAGSDIEVVQGNLFIERSWQGAGERIEPLLQASSLRLERIVSVAHASPPDQWYDQAHPEWVAVLRGSAGLVFEGSSEILVLRAGDYILIPAHRRHRVEWTDASSETIWLALHYTP